jgi:hypothetical protein
MNSLDSLTEAMASLHVRRVRHDNSRLRSETDANISAAAALRAQLTQQRAQARIFSQMQQQLSVLVPQAPRLPKAPARLPSPGEKRTSTQSHDETLAWRAELEQESGPDLASDVELIDDPPTAASTDDVVSEPEEAEPARMTSPSVHDELRHELRVRTRLSVKLARQLEEVSTLRERLASNDSLIARLQSLNSSLMAELQLMRERCSVGTGQLDQKRIRAECRT